MRCASAPTRAENSSIDDRQRQERGARLERGVPEVASAGGRPSRKVVAPNAAYTANVTAFAPENCRDRKTSQRHHRVRRRAPRRRGTPTSARDPEHAEHDGRGRPGRRRPLDQPVDDADRARTPAEPAPGRRCATAHPSSRVSGTWRMDDHERRRDQRQVDEEHQPPRHRVDEVAAEERPDRDRDARRAPTTHRSPARGRRGGTTPR